MLKKLGIMLLVLGTGSLLSSCLVNKKDVKTIARSTDSLHIYQPGEFIEYNVTAIVNPGASTSLGTLRVEWTQTADLQNPFDNNTRYRVLKETTTLSYEAGSSETDVTIIRYISQDSSGSVTLYAIDDGTDLYWLYDPNDVAVPSADIMLPVIFDSPMAVGVPPPNTSVSSPVKFSVMEGCDTGVCGTEIYTFSDGFEIVGDSTPVTTNIGKFSNPFEIRFSGTAQARNSPAVEFWGDIRDACGTSADTISHEGNLFVMPEIGVVRMTSLCQNLSSDSGKRVNYIITLNNTNIS